MENTLSRLDSYNVLNQDEMMDIDGGSWADAGVAMSGTLLVAWGFVVAVAVPGGQFAGGAAMVTGVNNLMSLRR